MAKSIKRDNPVAAAANRSTRSARPATVKHGDIARRAYDFYLARGGAHGHHVDDWLRAQRELEAAADSTVGRR